MTAQIQMPQYQCHKEVWALKIKAVDTSDRQYTVLTFEDERYGQVAKEIDEKFREKIQPGWYMVQYEDGYISYSPEKAFEEGYTLISDQT